MLYRKLTADGDYSFGRGRADFWRDVPEAPAQAVKTRLHLERGEWFLDLDEGTPWRTRVLGRRTADTRDPVTRARILGTTGVTGISAYSSRLDRETRAFTAQATIDTAYGRTTISEPI
ncbi:hypothetical protein [Salinarimonas soli]|uniref:Uncharacterized protein n=1 Tax=Salinarimonas soli TaxID=1638099 RepID=A0A5B2VDR0_9HYPH|nr:hypothetical protein [Salinarimonas soli]KAA2237663.1 hypothetical protein F0L46_08255 [Salinarimonas soli]